MTPVSEDQARRLLTPLSDMPPLRRREPTPRARARRPMVAVAGGLCAVLLAVFMVQSFTNREDLAQAVISRTAATLSTSGVLHVEFTETGYGRPKPLHLQMWSHTDPNTGRYTARVVHPGPGKGTLYPVGEQAIVAAKGSKIVHTSDFVAATGKIVNGTQPNPHGGAPSVGLEGLLTPQTFKELLHRPGTKVAKTTYHGIPAYTITPKVTDPDDVFNSTITVTQDSYRILELRDTGGYITYTTFETLPATNANVSLTRADAFPSHR